MDRAQLAHFLRTRREALQPEDVGLPRGPRRRTGGLRREEVASLSGMSTDYYSRLEQQRGPRPSEQMLAALARGLRLSLAERDHLFQLGGHAAPHRTVRADHVNPGMMRILDRIQDTPAMVVNHLGETLAQTPPAVALLGDETRHTGLARSLHHRWYTDPDTRRLYPAETHATHS
ncbi:helix-turn-helix domain-containing protein, partial [Micromonospora azadirachtae]